MKFPFLYAVCLLLAIIAAFAGCSSSPSVPVTGTPVQYTSLSELTLLPAEMPFVAVSEQTKEPNLHEPRLSQFGALRGFTKFSMNEMNESPTSVQLGQMIVEYPPGKSTLAFADFEQSNRNADQSRYKISWLPDPRIGDQSSAFVVNDSRGESKPTAMIVFVKSNIMESVVMVSPSPDVNTLARAAKIAAGKIPS
jgi:hypothetical protein